MNSPKMRILFGAFLALWVVSLAWFGAVSPAAVAIVAAGTAVLWVASVFLLEEPVHGTWSAIAVGAAAAVVVAIQVVPLPSGAFPYTESLRARHGVAGTAAGTGDLFLTVRQLAQIAAYVMGGMFVKRLVDAGLKRMDVVAGVVAVLVLEGAYAVAQVGFSFQDIPFYGRRWYTDSASGTLVNRNSFAGLMAIGLALATAAAWARFTSPRNTGKWPALKSGLPWAIAAALFAGCVALSKSRGGALAAGAGILALPFLVRRRVPATSVLGLALLAGLGTAAVLAADADPLIERFETIDPDHVGSEMRVQCWAASLAGWKRQPVFGFGIGSFPETFRPFQPPSLPGDFHHAHNEYVNALFEGGVAWLAVLLGAFAVWLWRALRGLRRLDGSERAAAAACVAAVLAIAIHSLVDFDLRITSVGLLFAVMLGAALSNSSSPRTARRILAAGPALAAIALAVVLGFVELEPEAPARRAAARDPREGEVALAAVLRRSPYDPFAASFHAVQAERREDLVLAAERIQTAADLWPANPALQGTSALWFLDHDDRARATPCFRRFFEQRPSAVARTIAPRWSPDAPVAPWEPFLSSPEACANFAGFLARSNHWGDAAAVFSRGVPAEAKYARHFDQLAEAFHQAGQWGLEATLREQRLALKSDAQAQAATAAAWTRLEVWDKALEHIRIALLTDPGHTEWHVTYARILEAKGDSMSAIEALTLELQAKPDSADLLRLRGLLYAKQELHLLAIDDFRAVLRRNPGDRESSFGLARALVESGRSVEALAAMNRWLESHPTDSEAREVRDGLKK